MTDKRAKKVAKRVEAWQQALPWLGMTHWTVEAVSMEDMEQHSLASVTPSSDYDRVWFTFDNTFVDECFEDDRIDRLDQVIIHEWVHVAFRDYYRAIVMVEDQLSDPMIANWKDAMEHANEALVDRLARQLYDDLKEYVVP